MVLTLVGLLLVGFGFGRLDLGRLWHWQALACLAPISLVLFGLTLVGSALAGLVLAGLALVIQCRKRFFLYPAGLVALVWLGSGWL